MEKYLQELVAKIPEIKEVEVEINRKSHHLSVGFTWRDAEGNLKGIESNLPVPVDLANTHLHSELNSEEALHLVAQELRKKEWPLARLRYFFLSEVWNVWKYYSLEDLRIALNSANTCGYAVHQVIPEPGKGLGIIVLRYQPNTNYSLDAFHV